MKERRIGQKNKGIVGTMNRNGEWKKWKDLGARKTQRDGKI